MRFHRRKLDSNIVASVLISPQADGKAWQLEVYWILSYRRPLRLRRYLRYKMDADVISPRPYESTPTPHRKVFPFARGTTELQISKVSQRNISLGLASLLIDLACPFVPGLSLVMACLVFLLEKSVNSREMNMPLAHVGTLI